jgi:serine/threonine protein kinase
MKKQSIRNKPRLDSSSPKTISTDEFYGEGSFGCVFRPTPKCVGNEQSILDVKKKQDSTKDVAKIFVDKGDYEVEKKAAITISKADKKGKNILIPRSGCRTNYREVLEVPISRECDELNKLKQIYGDQGNLYMLKMPYGGVTLDHYTHTNVLSVKDFMKTMLPVFEAIAKIRTAKLCHQDIKSINILVRTEGEMKDKAWLIDYSLLEKIADIYSYKNHRRLHHSYFPYPPEYKLFSYIIDTPESVREKEDCKPFEKVLENILHFGSHRTKTYFNLHDRIQTHKTILDIYQEMNNRFKKGSSELKEWITQNAAPKVDIYSTGMVLIDNDYILVRSGLSKDYLKKYDAFVAKCTHPDFRKRYTAQGAYRMAKMLAE